MEVSPLIFGGSIIPSTREACEPAALNRPHVRALLILGTSIKTGPKNDAAMKHYQAAKKANTAKNDADTNKELDAATHDLS